MIGLPSVPAVKRGRRRKSSKYYTRTHTWKQRKMMKFIKLERKTLLRLGVLLLCVLMGVQGCQLASHTSPAAGCRIQTTASASRRALLTGRVSSQAQRAQAKQRTDSKTTQPISLNRATQAELENLPGIGEKKAQAILAYRDAHGRFRSCEELLEVDGIGEATLEGLLPYLTLE